MSNKRRGSDKNGHGQRIPRHDGNETAHSKRSRDNPAARGDKFYFGSASLLAWHGEDGKAKDPSSSDFKTMGDKLMSEAAAFRKLAVRT